VGALPETASSGIAIASPGLPLEMTKMVLESGWLTEGEKAYELTGQSLALLEELS
jgi:hypothetical protein